MPNIKEEFIFYGDDILVGRFPEQTRFLYANPPLRPIANSAAAVRHALNNPIGAKPLNQQVRSTDFVVIAFDDPCLPVPLPANDPRALVIREILAMLHYKGVKNVRLLCANGLHRKFTLAELSSLIGKDNVRQVGKSRVLCHDGTDRDNLVQLGLTSQGAPVEVNRMAVECDLLIYVNVNFTTMNGGWKSLLVGLGSWESIRRHHNPAIWSGEESLLDFSSNPMHAMLKEMGLLTRAKVNLFQVECVINNRMWMPPADRLLAPLQGRFQQRKAGHALRTLLSTASLLPGPVKGAARKLLKANYQLAGIHAGDVTKVHEKTLQMLVPQQNVRVTGQSDIIILGVPELSPYAVNSIQNPILMRSLALGYLAGAFCGRPLAKKGGIVIVSNPGLEQFSQRHHPSYLDFWNRDLPLFFDPELAWNALAEPYAKNPHYLNLYRNHFAYHGTHSLMNWMWSGMALRHFSAAILAGAKQPQTAYKLGFIPARNLDHAINLALERMGRDASVTYPVIPPLFAADVKE
ncbi:MAG: lactate racemase domain-containing protein [Desulfatibacillaceae bacterium]|nr:lactate racemase domain-containing protein [Desulfatibacillaceae bacterium]